MSEVVLVWIMGGAFVCIGGVFAVTTKKVNKADFEKHCDHDREDHKEMYKTIKDMSEKITTIHAIVKERGK